MAMKRIVARKLDMRTHGPSEFAIVSEQELIALGYRWTYDVYLSNGICVRSGTAKTETYEELLEFLDSGMTTKEWSER